MVVDDEPDQRFLLRRIFERVGHYVSDAGDGAPRCEQCGSRHRIWW